MKLRNIIISATAVSLGLAGCSDQMDYHEFRIQGEDFIQRDFGSVGNLLTSIYRNLDYDFGQMHSGAGLCSATDEAVYSHQGNSIESYFNGSWSATNPNSAIWSPCWDAIAYCNLYLDKFTGLTFPEHELEKTYVDEMKKYENFQYEVRFMRAYYYFLLVRQYGRVPLITRYMEYDEANAQPQVSTDSIFEFIDRECEAIQDSIIQDYIGAYGVLPDSHTGRVNNLGVMALRARAALYHASPLFTEGKDEAAVKELWYQAALRSKECIDACRKRSMRLCNDYAALFSYGNWNEPEPQKEIIFGRRFYPKDNNWERRNFPIGMAGAEGGNCPTENLVSAYEMRNGLPISDPDSGYDPQDPYKNRDKRLAVTVAVNGEKWPQNLPTDALELWYGGSNSRSVSYGTPTGYYLKKYVDGTAKISGSGQTSQNHTWVLFRLGQVYLDYAEAVLNYTGSGYDVAGELSMTAAEAINMVRTRAGQPDLPKNLSADEFARRYRNERFVELAFEGHRMFDVRRWKMGADYFTNIIVMEITKEGDKITYKPVANPPYITRRTWAGDYQNLWPIPQSEILKSGALVQNEGWH